jgi:fibronectin type 3 domain-containing protein
MRKILILVFLLAALACPAAEVMLAWDKNPANQGRETYRLYQQEVGGSAHRVYNLPANPLTFKVVGLSKRKTYDFYITAVSEAGVESGPSNHVTFQAQ